MKHIKVRNVGHAFVEGFWHMRLLGPDRKFESRNGPVLVSPGPVITEYEYPMERVLLNSQRDANPVFHLMEAIWMIAGANNVDFLLPFNEKFGQYAEPDGTVWGAYGHRWVNRFGFDQIAAVIKELRLNPTSRRAVIGMWFPDWDLGAPKADLPCNTHIYFGIENGALNMTVCCRSNDMLWGAYGANAVHFSILQELIAIALGVQIGTYWQFSNNFHLYTDLPMVQRFLQSPPAPLAGEDPYDSVMSWVPLCSGDEQWDWFVGDCINMVAGRTSFSTTFMREVAEPLRRMYLARKARDKVIIPESIKLTDWGHAFSQWAARRDAR